MNTLDRRVACSSTSQTADFNSAWCVGDHALLWVEELPLEPYCAQMLGVHLILHSFSCLHHHPGLLWQSVREMGMDSSVIDAYFQRRWSPPDTAHSLTWIFTDNEGRLGGIGWIEMFKCSQLNASLMGRRLEFFPSIYSKFSLLQMYIF